MSDTLYRLQVMQGHRYDQLSVATKTGKIWVGKDEAVTIGSSELLEGEVFKLRRYREEGRMIVAEMASNGERKPRRKRRPETLPDYGATEAAVVLAHEHDIDLASIEGTGKDGRVIYTDVQALLE